MSNILVTGIAGFIGSVVAEHLINEGHSIIGIDNFQEGNKNAVIKNITFYEGDFGDRTLLENIFQNNTIEYVFHFAAETTIEFSMTDPYIYFHNNVTNGLTLLEVMRQYSCNQIIFSSTAATFGEPLYHPIDEKHPQIPINAYGESKLFFEKILEWYHNSYGFKYNLFRYFNASGATKINGEDRKHESHLLPMALNTALGKRDGLKVFGNDYPTKDGTCIRDYIHVADIAEAHILGMKNLKAHPNAKYNLGSGNGFTVLEIVNSIEKLISKKINWEFEKKRIGDPAILVASCELAKNELKWNPRRSSIENIINTAYEWLLSHPNGYDY